MPLAPLTTLELGGHARFLLEAADDATLVGGLRWAGARGLRVFLLGGGSNVLIADGGLDGLVIRLAQRGRRYEERDAHGVVRVHALAGEPWDELVADTVTRGLTGLEGLSGIPGSTGATPIQNVGAYGHEVAEVIESVRVLDLATLEQEVLSPEACRFGYRVSVFKREPGAYAVLEVSLALRVAAEPFPTARVLHPDLRAALSGLTATPAEVRSAVLALRRRKSMLLDPGDENRRSVGSFFTNPVVDLAQAELVAARAVSLGFAAAPADVPVYAAEEGSVKLSAGWLIEHAGFHKGQRWGHVGLSSRHALALVHHGGGTTAELLEAARQVHNRVQEAFGIRLVPEPILLGDLRWPPPPRRP